MSVDLDERLADADLCHDTNISETEAVASNRRFIKAASVLAQWPLCVVSVLTLHPRTVSTCCCPGMHPLMNSCGFCKAQRSQQSSRFCSCHHHAQVHIHHICMLFSCGLGLAGAPAACTAAGAVHDITRAFCTRCGEFNCERHGSTIELTDDALANAGGGLAGAEPFKDFDKHAKQWTAPCGPNCYKISETAPSTQPPASTHHCTEFACDWLLWISRPAVGPVTTSAHSCCI